MEVAKINFKLAVAGVAPLLPIPWQDLSVEVGQEQPAGVNYLTGCKINFLTSYQ
jgi:hypothetical protein